MKKLILAIVFASLSIVSQAITYLDYHDEDNYTVDCGKEVIDGIEYQFLYIVNQSTNGIYGAKATVLGPTDDGAKQSEIIIPQTLSHHSDDYPDITSWPVYSIAANAFNGGSYELISIPDCNGILFLSQGAFSNCQSLKNVIFNGRFYQQLNVNAFIDCNVDLITFKGMPLYNNCIGDGTTVKELLFTEGATFTGGYGKTPINTTATVYGTMNCNMAPADILVLKGKDGEIASTTYSSFDAYSLANVKELWLYVTTPPACTEYAFQTHNPGSTEPTVSAAETLKLYVPEEALTAYRNDAVWGKVKNICAIETGVSPISKTDATVIDTTFYDLSGRIQSTPLKDNLYIKRERLSDGSSRSELIRY